LTQKVLFVANEIGIGIGFWGGCLPLPDQPIAKTVANLTADFDFDPESDFDKIDANRQLEFYREP
jgi:hypothetical protein